MPPRKTEPVPSTAHLAGTLYLGIDPGASGGLVCLDGDVVCSTPMPTTERDVWDWVWSRATLSPTRMNVFAVIEQVGGFVKGGSEGKGGGSANGSAMFKFGTSYGGLRMALVAAGIPFEAVTPRTWQAGLGIPTRKKSESKTDWKGRLRARAQQLYPQCKVTLAVADALLIAEYAKRWKTGTL